MNYMRTDYETVRRLYPRLIEVVEGEDPDSAACALCTALTILCWREGYSLEGLLWQARGSIEHGWQELSKGKRRRRAPRKKTINGEDKNNE